ncbi:MAG: hypothetical protein RML36_15385 [Anaerolineae bacterium]|nr:hypothetical protein [Anaerolineae bacterium]
MDGLRKDRELLAQYASGVGFQSLGLLAKAYRFLSKARSSLKRHRTRYDSKAKQPDAVIEAVGEAGEFVAKLIIGTLHRLKIGRWLEKIQGAGGVIGGLVLGIIDLRKTKSAGSIWRYAGLDPTWPRSRSNRYLRYLLCTAFANQFIRQAQLEDLSGDHLIYGKVFKWYLGKLSEANEQLKFKQYALAKAEKLERSQSRYRDLSIYKAGKLPHSHLFARARRFTCKLFLSHLFEVGYYDLHGKEAPQPYILTVKLPQGGPIRIIRPPFFTPQWYDSLPGIGLKEFYESETVLIPPPTHHHTEEEIHEQQRTVNGFLLDTIGTNPEETLL